MKLQDYLNLQDEYVIKHLSLNENICNIVDNEFYKELYNYFSKNDKVGFHLLTYSNDLDNHITEFYVITNQLSFEKASEISNDNIKLQVNYNENTLMFTLNINVENNKVKVPITFDLVEKQISFELSRLLKQKRIDIHFISSKEGLLYKEHTVKVFITEKIKSVIVEFLELFLDNYNLEDQKTISSFDDILIHNEIEYLNIPIKRDDIESMNISKYVNMLTVLYPNVLITHNYCENIDFILQGYEGDKRENWQIPEVRKFIKALSQKFDQWLYFFDKNSQSLYWVTMCLCGKGFGENDKYLMNHLSFNDFINEQLKNLNELCHYLNDTNKYNEIKESTFKYFNIHS